MENTKIIKGVGVTLIGIGALLFPLARRIKNRKDERSIILANVEEDAVIRSQKFEDAIIADSMMEIDKILEEDIHKQHTNNCNG